MGHGCRGGPSSPFFLFFSSSLSTFLVHSPLFFSTLSLLIPQLFFRYLSLRRNSNSFLSKHNHLLNSASLSLSLSSPLHFFTSSPLHLFTLTCSSSPFLFSSLLSSSIPQPPTTPLPLPLPLPFTPFPQLNNTPLPLTTTTIHHHGGPVYTHPVCSKLQCVL
ncbi:MAG: hypothetical protein J3R72DRAFT_227972 [Linnemannia gamsii]|nr:MAG: hypothetical protein J3R72DRAFT_227972 [Linnemannia gamsii]